MIIELSGSHYEMGKQHGQKLHPYRASVSDLVQAHQKQAHVYSQEAISELTKETEEVLTIHSPQTLDLIHGIADGFSLSRKDLFSMMIGSYYEDKGATSKNPVGCTTWAYSGVRPSKTGVLLAKNRDYLMSHQRLQVVFRCKPERGMEYFSVNSVGAPMVFSSGINEAGLAVADTRVPSYDAGPGLPRYTLMMHILENFQRTAEVLDYLRSVPRMGGGNLVFADRSGEIGSAEVGFHKIDLQHKSQGFLVCTNHFEGPSMKSQYRQKEERKRRDSKWRAGEAAQGLSTWQDGADFDRASRLMAVHGDAFSICVHRGLNPNDETATLSSVIYLPAEKGFYFCQGFPCSIPYEWISFAAAENA